jgi:hypothetical protein
LKVGVNWLSLVLVPVFVPETVPVVLPPVMVGLTSMVLADVPPVAEVSPTLPPNPLPVPLAVVSPTVPPVEVMLGVKVMVGLAVDEPPKPLPPKAEVSPTLEEPPLPPVALPPAPPKPPAPPAAHQQRHQHRCRRCWCRRSRTPSRWAWWSGCWSGRRH